MAPPAPPGSGCPPRADTAPQRAACHEQLPCLYACAYIYVDIYSYIYIERDYIQIIYIYTRMYITSIMCISVHTQVHIILNVFAYVLAYVYVYTCRSWYDHMWKNRYDRFQDTFHACDFDPPRCAA